MVRFVLILAAVILFIIAALAGFGVISVDPNTVNGLGWTGFACFAGSFLVPGELVHPYSRRY